MYRYVFDGITEIGNNMNIIEHVYTYNMYPISIIIKSGIVEITSLKTITPY